MTKTEMDDRVHAALVAYGLDMGMDGTEALGWANLRMKSMQADLIRVDLATADLYAQLTKAAEAAGAKVVRALGGRQ